MKKRILGILLTLCMVFSLLPFGASAASSSALGEHYLSGRAVDNQSENDYYWYWSQVMNSYLYETGNGALMRVQYDGSQVLIENYTSAYQLSGTKTIAMELPIFGGFYADGSYYFLVFGHTNYDENDSQEVLRVVKYDHSWNRLGSASVYGANTYEPFEAGSLRMVETAGKLYVYTCHTMYDRGDGLHHQANMIYTIDVAGMYVTDSYYRVWNISEGYVSHSFNQFICTDGSNIYRADHGDAHPRSVVLIRNGVYSSVASVSSLDVFPITGQSGSNYTGVTVGGMELSNSNVLIAGTSIDQSNYSSSEQSNIFVTVTAKDFSSTTTKWITGYAEGKDVEVFPPQLTKISDNQFLLMWEEKSYELGTCTRMVTIDGNGDKSSSIVTAPVRLSDCKPIALSNGRVAWYVCPNNSTLELCTIDPNRLDELNLRIRVNPKSVKVSESQTAKFTVEASGIGLSYQWQYKAPNGSWTDSTLTGSKTDTLKVKAIPSRNGLQYRCIVLDRIGQTVSSNAATLTVQALHFTTQPKDRTANNGEKVKFTVAAVGTGLTYQWQYRSPGGSWKNSSLTGSKTDTMTVTAVSTRNGLQYRCKVTDNRGTVITSGVAKLTTQDMKVTTQPKAVSANVGETVKFTAKATGVKLTYQWQYKVPGGSWKNSTLTGCKTSTLKVPANNSRNGLQYRCKITDSAGNTVITKAVKLTVQKLHVTTQPKAITATAGATVKFTVKATGYSLTYQWQYKAPGGSWKNSTLTGCKTATLKVSVNNSRNGFQYRCIITDSAGSKVTSSAARLTVK